MATTIINTERENNASALNALKFKEINIQAWHMNQNNSRRMGREAERKSDEEAFQKSR